MKTTSTLYCSLWVSLLVTKTLCTLDPCHMFITYFWLFHFQSFSHSWSLCFVHCLVLALVLIHYLLLTPALCLLFTLAVTPYELCCTWHTTDLYIMYIYSRPQQSILFIVITHITYTLSQQLLVYKEVIH